MTLQQKYITTLITDPILEPFAIGQEKYAGFVVLEVRKGTKTERTIPVSYPSSFSSALEYIIRQKMCEESRYNTLQDYIQKYLQIRNDIYNVLGKEQLDIEAIQSK